MRGLSLNPGWACFQSCQELWSLQDGKKGSLNQTNRVLILSFFLKMCKSKTSTPSPEISVNTVFARCRRFYRSGKGTGLVSSHAILPHEHDTFCWGNGSWYHHMALSYIVSWHQTPLEGYFQYISSVCSFGKHSRATGLQAGTLPPSFEEAMPWGKRDCQAFWAKAREEVRTNHLTYPHLKTRNSSLRCSSHLS